MSRLRLSFLIVLSFSILSCIQKRTAALNTDLAEETSTPSDGTSRLIVSFFSPGNGIDKAMQSQFSNFLSSSYAGLKFESVKWGREGEVDYCFVLNELSTEEQEAFIKECRLLLSSSKRVRIKENEKCREI